MSAVVTEVVNWLGAESVVVRPLADTDVMLPPALIMFDEAVSLAAFKAARKVVVMPL